MAENLTLFDDMRRGLVDEGQMTLRWVKVHNLCHNCSICVANLFQLHADMLLTSSCKCSCQLTRCEEGLNSN